MTEQEKPDASVRVNDFDVTLYRRGRGLFIRVHKDDVEVGFFGIAGGSPVTSASQQTEHALPPVPVSPLEPQTELPTAPTSSTPVSAEKKAEQPVKLTGIVEAIE